MFAINLFSSIEKKRKCNLFTEGKPICEYLKKENINYEHCIILCGGKKIDENYIAKENDIIFVRELPSAATTVAIIITSVVAVAAGVAAGVSLYKAKQAQAEAEKAMKNASQNAKSTNIEALPFLKGATNQSATGRSMPYVIGRHYFTPYRLQPKYYEVLDSEGKTEFCNIVLEAGFNNLVIESISLGNNKIATFGTYEQIKKIAPQNLITQFDHGTYFNDDNIIEIQQSEDFTTSQFNKKIVSNFINQEIKNDYGTPSADIEPVVTQLESNAKSCDICIMFDGLRKYVNNVWGNQSVTIAAYWSNLDSPETTDLTQWNEFPAFEQMHWDGTYNYIKSNYYRWYGNGSESQYPRKNNSDPDQMLKNAIISEGLYKWIFISGDDESYLNNVVPDASNIYDLTYNLHKTDIYFGFSNVHFKYAIKKEKNYTIKFNSNTFTYNSNRQLRFVAHKDFLPSESYGKNISIMLKRTTPKAQANSNESCYLYYVNTEVYDPQKSSSTELVTCKPIEDDARAKCCRIGIRMKADDNNESLSDSVNIVACGVARTWDSTTETWTEEKTPTRNGAAWILEVLTSHVHAWSKFNDNEIVLDSLGQLYETCETKGYYVDGVITEDRTKQSVLDELCAACHCSLIWNADGKLEVVEDKAENNAIALLNTQDISDFTVSKAFERKIDGYKVTFTNSESWSKETFYCMKDGTSDHDANDVITEIAPNFITTYSHAWDIARRSLAESYLQPKTLTVNVGKEGAYYPIHSCVLVQLPHLKIGITSSVIKALIYEDGAIIGIKIADKVTLEDDKSYGVIIQQINDYGKHILQSVVTGEGTTDTLYLDGSVWNHIPTADNIISFGELTDDNDFDYVTEKFKICGVESADNGYKLTLKEYNASIYDDSGAIPDYVSPIPQSAINSANRNVQYSNDDIREQIDEAQEIAIATAQSFAQGVNVYSDVSNIGFLVDENGITLNKQTISFDLHVVQGGTTEVDFIYGQFDTLPEGIHISKNYHTITVTIDAGTKLVNGSLKIPVIYRLIEQFYQYEDEDGNNYKDEDGTIYGCYKVSDTEKEYDFIITYTGVKGGNKIDRDFTTLTDISTYTFLVGDYFTFKGDSVESSLSATGSFDKGATYIYCGIDSDRTYRFKVDDNTEHMMTSLSDVLSVLDEEIEANNVKTVTLLNRLVANNIFVKQLVAQNAFIENLTASESFAEKLTANEAFIENLMSNNLTVGNAIQSSNYVEGTSGFKLSRDGTINANSGRFSSYIGYESVVTDGVNEYTIKGQSGMLSILVEQRLYDGSRPGYEYIWRPYKTYSTLYSFKWGTVSGVLGSVPIDLILSDSTGITKQYYSEGGVSSTIKIDLSDTWGADATRIRIVETLFSKIN